MADSRPTVQRTLVKSPPELWADLSNPESLSKRLGEFGEIRITRLIPEKTVAWEGERASGTVEIEPSGWGTKVRISARAIAPPVEQAAATEEDLEREAAIEAALRAEIEREAAIEAALRAELELEREAEAKAEAQLRAQAEAEAKLEAERVRASAVQARPSTPRPDAAPEPERGFFSRFRKRRRPDAVVSPPPPQVARPDPRPTAQPITPDTAHVPTPAQPALPSAPVEPAFPASPARPARRAPVRLSALAFAPAHPNGQAQAKPKLDDAETLAVLSGVLDDLGSAHHRPFSRELP
jgi:hypothetical protein